MTLNEGYQDRDNSGLDKELQKYPFDEEKECFKALQNIKNRCSECRHYDVRQEAIRIVLAQARLRRRMQAPDGLKVMELKRR